MSEQRTGVTVEWQSGANTRDTNYPNADGIRVDEGHLHVCRNGSLSDVVAIYAPSKWLNARVEGK